MTQFFNPLSKSTASQVITVHCGGHAYVSPIPNEKKLILTAYGPYTLDGVDIPGNVEPELQAFWDEKRALLPTMNEAWSATVG